MHQVIITYDKYAGCYHVTVEVRKTFLFISYWSQSKRYRGPLDWSCRKAVSLSNEYGVEVINRCPVETKSKLK